MSDGTYRDPGWRKALIGLIPFVGPFLARRGQRDGLTALRMIFLGVVSGPLLFLLVLLFIVQPGPDESATISLPYTAGVAALGIASLGIVGWMRQRPLDTSSPEKLAGSYRGTFFLGIGLANSPVLIGYVGVFLVDELWPYLVAMGLSLLAFLLVAPSSRDIERRQREISSRGSSLSLGRALMEAPTTRGAG